MGHKVDKAVEWSQIPNVPAARGTFQARYLFVEIDTSWHNLWTTSTTND